MCFGFVSKKHMVHVRHFIWLGRQKNTDKSKKEEQKHI